MNEKFKNSLAGMISSAALAFFGFDSGRSLIGFAGLISFFLFSWDVAIPKKKK